MTFQLGYTGNNGTSDLSYDASVGDRRVVGPNSPGTFRNQQVYGGGYADFAQNYDPINSYYQGAAGGSYRVNQGDTLQRIAQSLYGDSSLWYKIAEANGLSAAAALVEGQTLVLPTGVLNAKNNAGTFKPYNAGEAIGDLSPSTPQPPKKPKCGVFGQILLAVIAIAVTALTYGALGGTALSAWAAVGAGAVAGAAGSIASQAVGVATGIQDKFSFKGVALAAIGGAIGGGLGPKGLFGTNGAFGNIGSQFVGDALRGAVGSALTQGVGVATGLQDKFSWAGVAAAGIGAGIGGAVGRALTSPGGLFGVSASAGSFGYRMATSAASGIANAATRSAINGESFGKNLIAALPDIIGQAVGGLAGKELSSLLDMPAAQVTEDPLAQLAKLGSFDPITQDILAADEIVVTGTVYHTEDMSLYSSALATSVTGYNVKNRIIKDLHSQYLQAQILPLPKSGTGKDITVKMLSPNGLRDNPNLEGVPTTAVSFTPWQSEHDSRLSTYMAYRTAGIASGEIYDPYDHDWVMKGFADEQVYINKLDAIADRAVWDVAVAGVQPLAFGTGAYRIGVNGEHTFDNYLAAASPLIGPLAKYGARFVGSGLRSAGNSTSVVEGGALSAIHKNSLKYVGDTHVYAILGPDGSLFKVGESARGVRVGDGASIRAEEQARALFKETGDVYRTEIRQSFGGKADARAYETRFIQTYERLFGQRPPGNPINR